MKWSIRRIGELWAEENGIETRLRPGDTLCWRAGDAVAHRLINRSALAARYLVIGTRAMRDTITDPQQSRILHSDRSASWRRYITLASDPAATL